MKRLFVLCLAVVAFAGCEDEFGFDKAKIELSRSDFDGTYWTEVDKAYVQYINGKAAGLIDDMDDSPYPPVSYPYTKLKSKAYRYYYGDTLKIYAVRSYENASTTSSAALSVNVDIDNKVLRIIESNGYNLDYEIITLTADTMRLADPQFGTYDPNDYYKCIMTYVRVRPDAALMDRFSNAVSPDEANAFWLNYFGVSSEPKD